MTALSGPAGAATFIYDALGRRISKTINGVKTEYLYDGNNIVAEIQSGAMTATYLLSLNIDEPFMRFTATGAEYYHTDALGSVIALTDSSGTTTTTYRYDPFGSTVVTGTSTNPFQYTARENDGTGLYYYRARYYSPRLHRFLSEDPIGFAGGDVNLYAYVNNRPLFWRDPFGLWTVQIGVNVSVGLAGGFSVSGTLAIDSSGQVGLVGTVGGGGYGGMGGSGTIQVTVTNANTIQDLGGSGQTTGIAVGKGLVVEGGYVGGGTGKNRYGGFYVGVGKGLKDSTLVSETGGLTNTGVMCKFKCNDDNNGGNMGGRKGKKSK